MKNSNPSKPPTQSDPAVTPGNSSTFRPTRPDAEEERNYQEMRKFNLEGTQTMHPGGALTGDTARLQSHAAATKEAMDSHWRRLGHLPMTTRPPGGKRR